MGPNSGTVMTMQYGRATRRLEFRVGRQYVIAPLNPQARRHRGRVVSLVGFDNEFMPSMALVRFEDTGRTGKVPCDYLAEVGTPFEVSIAAQPVHSLAELRKRAALLAPRLADLPTKSRMSEWRTLSGHLGRATSAANKDEIASLLAMLVASAATGIAKVQKRDVKVVLEELRSLVTEH